MKTFPGYVREETPAHSVVMYRHKESNISADNSNLKPLICLGFTNYTSVLQITQLTPYSLIHLMQQDLMPTDNNDIRAQHFLLKPGPREHHFSSEEIWDCRSMSSATWRLKSCIFPISIRLCRLGLHANALPLFGKDCKN